ncbi:MAG: protein-tyrosine kinase [Solirubrobacterales bacterium]|jgi:receptor protein-tyrosine kinase|nr:protein-tyrosine kinase [Solirubrobacterales bacterium]
MLRRSRLPVLAEIAGPPEATRAWALTGRDFEALGEVLPRLAEQRVVAVAGEGDEPAVAAIALASAAAASGSRTILVECDLARPRLAAQVGLAPSPGLHEYLRWEAEPADVLQPVALAGPATAAGGQLVCICGGRPATKAETLLGLQSFAHVVEKLRAAYELVLLVAPPVLGEPTACLAVAAQADAAVAGLPASSDRAALSAIRRLPSPVLGAIAVG